MKGEKKIEREQKMELPVLAISLGWLPYLDLISLTMDQKLLYPTDSLP